MPSLRPYSCVTCNERKAYKWIKSKRKRERERERERLRPPSSPKAKNMAIYEPILSHALWAASALTVIYTGLYSYGRITSIIILPFFSLFLSIQSNYFEVFFFVGLGSFQFDRQMATPSPIFSIHLSIFIEFLYFHWFIIDLFIFIIV